MNHTAQIVSWPRETSAALSSARVVSVAGRELELELGNQTVTAGLAFSCLVQPRPDDLALCARLESGDYAVLAVLDRPGAQDMNIAFPANAGLTAAGTVTVHGAEALNLVSGGKVNTVADEYSHDSRTASIRCGEVTAHGEKLTASFSVMTFIAQTVSTLARLAVERFVSYIRRSEDYDEIQAGQMSRKTDGLYSLDTRVTMMVSKKDTKIDGERIFMA